MGSLVTLEKRLVALGIQTNVSQERIDGLYKSVQNIAMDEKISVDSTEILNAVDAIVERTGNLELAEKNLRNIGLAISASGAAGVDIGALVSNLFSKFDIKDSQTMNETLDMLVNQGKAGSFTLQNLATQAEKVTAAYTALGHSGKDSVRDMGALLQVIRSGAPSAEVAASSFDAFLATISSSEKIEKLRQQGVAVRNANGEFYSAVEIYKNTIKAAGGDKVKLSQIFGEQDGRALAPMLSEFKRTGEFKSLDDFGNVLSDGTSLMNDSARSAETLQQQLVRLQTSFLNFASKNLMEPIRELTKFLNDIDSKKLEDLFDTIKIGVMSVGGVFALAASIRALGTIGGAAKGAWDMTNRLGVKIL